MSNYCPICGHSPLECPQCDPFFHYSHIAKLITQAEEKAWGAAREVVQWGDVDFYYSTLEEWRQKRDENQKPNSPLSDKKVP